MTTPRDPRRNPAADELPRDELLARAYRDAGADADGPPPALDARILAAAHAAAAAPRRPLSRPLPWWRRFAVPVSVAAVLVVSATLTLMVHEEQQKIQDLPLPARVPDVPPPQAAPAPATASDAAAGRGAAAAPDGAAAPAERKDAFRREEAVRKPPASLGDKAGNDAAVAPLREAAPAAAASAPPASPEAAPQPFPRDLERQAAPAARVPAPAAMPAPAAPAPAGKPHQQAPTGSSVAVPAEQDAAVRASRPRLQAEPDLAAPVPSAAPGAGPQSGVAGSAELPERAKARAGNLEKSETAGAVRMDAAKKSARSPEAWLDEIRELRRAGHEAEFRAALARFRERYPDYALPADLRD